MGIAMDNWRPNAATPPLTLQRIEQALAGEISGSQVLCPGPGHSAKDRSLAVKVGANGEILVHSFARDDWRECLDYVRARLGLPEFRQERPQKPPLGGQGKSVGYMDRAELERAASGLLWKAIWAEAHGLRRTLVDVYLQSRHLKLSDEAAFEAIRFHQACPFGSDRFPAMVCLVRNIVTNEPQGVHRTALAADGAAVKRNGKTFRMSLGSIAGGAIKLDSDEDVTQGLCIGEGVETALAGRQMGLRPTWSAVNTGGIANFPVLLGIEGLHIFRENDVNGASAKAVHTCGMRWHAAGRNVFVITPDIGTDLNDELGTAAQ
jgi:putative DNA primase/helicase